MDHPKGTEGEEPSENTGQVEVSLPDEEIAVLAHLIWIEKGRPDSSAAEDWFEARKELKALKEKAQRLAEKQTEEVSQLLHAILESTQAVIFVKDASGRYLLASRAFQDHWAPGLSVVGLSDSDLFSPQTAAALRVNDLRVLAEGISLEVEESLPQSPGAGTWHIVRFPLTGSRNVPYAVCGIAVDVTRQKRLQLHWELAGAVTQALAGSPDLDEAGVKLLQRICTTLGWSLGALWLVRDQSSCLTCAEIWHSPHLNVSRFVQASRSLRLTRGEGIPGRVWDAEKPMWFTELASDASLSRHRAFEHEELQSAIAFPVRNGGQIVGILEFFSRYLQEPDQGLLTVMSNVGSQISQYLHRVEAEKSLHQRNHELELARAIQQSLLPTRAPEVAGFEMAGVSRSAQETGGDYFDYFVEANGLLEIAIGDAAGHGMAAALLITEARSFVRALTLTGHTVHEIVSLTNRHFAGSADVGHFVTFFVAHVDPATRSLSYSSAGHCPGYLLSSTGAVKSVLYSAGMPLGISADARFLQTEPLQLAEGDVVFLYTDGIVEAGDEEGKQFGIERALRLVCSNVMLSPPEIIDALMTEVNRHLAGNQLDDMTIVCLKCLPGQAGQPGESTGLLQS